MEWSKFNTHGESVNHAFEVMCNILFEIWCKEEYGVELAYVYFINGSGGDGGVESYGILQSGDVIGVQAKWFPQKMETLQFEQIEKSFYTAKKVRPELKRYVVCVPRDLGSKKMTKGNHVAKNTEESRWKDLCKKIRREHPDVNIELWNETIIQEKLLDQKATGCFKYWFENSEIFEAEIMNAYQKAVNGWARTKYVPDLYSKGHIHDLIGMS